MKNRVLTLLLHPLIIVGLLCTVTVSPAHANQDNVVTLRWFLRWDQVRVERVAVPIKEAFEARYPHIRIEIENNGPSSQDYLAKGQTMMAGGVAPDILYPATHYGFAWAVQGQLLDLAPYIERDGIATDDYLFNILDLYSYNGMIWGLPVDSARLAIFYNENRFAEVGLAPPADGWTWDDFAAIARRLTRDVNSDGITDQYAIRDFTSYWPVMAWSFSGHGLFNDLFRPDHTLINSPAVVDGLQFLADLRNAAHVIPTSNDMANWQDAFPAGIAAMEMTGHWSIPTYSQILPFDWNIAPLPVGVTSVNRVDGSAFAIWSGTKHPEEAWEFVKFLASPEGLGIELLNELQQFTPVVRSLIQSPAFMRPPGLEHLNKAAFLAGEDLFSMYEPLGPMYFPIDAAMRQEILNIWNGQQSAAQAAARLEPVLNTLLETLRQRHVY